MEKKNKEPERFFFNLCVFGTNYSMEVGGNHDITLSNPGRNWDWTGIGDWSLTPDQKINSAVIDLLIDL